MKKIVVLILIIMAFRAQIFAQKTITQDERMQWWRDARFGMFIHWGLYAIPAGGKLKFDKPGTYGLSLIPQSFTENKIGFTFKEMS